MPEQPTIPPELAPFVQSVESPVTADDLDVYERFQHVRDRSFTVRTVLDAWERQQAEDRRLRKAYAKWLMAAVSAQLAVAAAAFFFIGFDVIQVESWVASVFFASVFAEVTGLALFVVKYLFPETGSTLPELIDDL